MQKNTFNQIASKGFWAILLGITSAGFAFALKTAGESGERYVFDTLHDINAWLLVLAPSVGLALIYVVTAKIFKAPIGGIREIISSLREPAEKLKPVKAVIHFITGFFTIVFGGSTGIEVSAVVGSSALGSWVGKWRTFDSDFRRHLIVAGAAAGISGLFKSPLAGIFFAVEVLMLTFSWELILLSILASFIAFAVRNSFDHSTMFHPALHGWKAGALPFYLLFSIVTSFFSVYLTRGVIQLKSLFSTRLGEIGRIWMGGILLGMMVLAVMPLYGEGYAFIDSLLMSYAPINDISGLSGILLLIVLLFLKPIATQVTLASGGDGGVFAPSLFLGAVAGALFGRGVNCVGASVTEINFVIVGMAATLSASLHAPLTAACLVMSITGSYELFVPIVLTSILSSFFARKIYPFTVYSYSS